MCEMSYLNYFKKIFFLAKAKIGTTVFPEGVVAGYYNVKNFGDQLTPDIFRHYGLRPFHTAVFRYCDVLGAGSILQMAPRDFGGAILGSGFISENKSKELPHANVYLVRGCLTRNLLKESHDTPIGDPGLIIDDVYSKDIQNSVKIWNVGIVPHYIDINHPAIKNIIKKNFNSTKLIDVRQTPKVVIRDISQCHYILSSSLHGLVAADSLAIPNKQIVLTGKIIGGDFKYNDYYSCFGKKGDPLNLDGTESLQFLISHTSSVDLDRLGEIKKGVRLAIQKFSVDYINNKQFFQHK